MQEVGHITLLKEAELYYESDELLTVHAGLAHWIPWARQQSLLDTASDLKRAGIFLNEPEQLINYDYATDWQRPYDVPKTLITGHHHKHGTSERTYSKFPRLYPDRVVLASHLSDGDPLFVYESWTGQVKTFEQ
jgi:hypothetical protein